MKLKIILMIFILIISGCIKRSEFKTVYLYMMDTLVEITLPYDSRGEFASVDLIMQTSADFVSVDSREISSHNEAVLIDESTYRLLEDEAEYFALSGGRFNATIITVSSLYGFPDKEKHIPDSRLLSEVKSRALGGRVKFWSSDGRFYANGGGLKVDLSSFAKGAIVDEAVSYLREKGVRNFIINAGGDLYASGLKDNHKWRVGITDPNDRRRYLKSLDITDKGVATSGSYERFFIADNGSRVSHIFDGVTGEPVNRYKSVTVVADTVKEADAFSTIYFLMSQSEIEADCSKNNRSVFIVDNDDKLITLCEFF